ncbi:MAG TPA: zinc transporter ZupT [Desulfitobacterium dehalogenans]|uniref:Zinc transporter ZupT n=1 Tax=Desulfitobacterium dehalogenans TaxID=36854 RepID=A0A7C7DD10_9FIRM|nr:zinc transporter ZupT [Desulfitobacterium dehalogenans]
MLDERALIALLLSFIAGMATLLGALIIFITKSKNEKILSASLGFAAGVMLSVSFLDLWTQSQQSLILYMGQKRGLVLSVAFLLCGILFALGIDHFVPHEEPAPDEKDKPHQNLYRVGFVSMLAIMFHNFPEGIATFSAGYEDLTMGISIAVAISMHNIPEGITVAMPIYFATGKKKDAFKYTFLSGMAEPLGALLAFLVLRPFINGFNLGAIFAIVAGIMIYIAIEELIPSSRQYGHPRLALFATFAGIIIMPLSHIF